MEQNFVESQVLELNATRLLNGLLEKGVVKKIGGGNRLKYTLVEQE